MRTSPVPVSSRSMRAVGVPAEISHVRHGTTATVSLCGEIDIGCVPELRSALNGALQTAPERVVIDLSAATFVDSSTVHAILDAHARAAGQHTALVLLAGPPAVQRTFELCGLLRTLSFVTPADQVRPSAA